MIPNTDRAHTPGPWRINKDAPENIEPNVAMVLGEGERDRANARLISAAPDLLALALRVAEHFHGTDAPLGLAARAALAKAGGA